jgi:hypothetical protein
MGMSIGSVPSVHISVLPIYSSIKGIVLISPIASGIKLIDPKFSINTFELEKIDVFCNLGKVSDISCPVFLIHGMQDDVIPQTQSFEMMKKIKYVYEWFPTRGNHFNITTKYRSKFYIKLKLFLEHLKYNKNKNSRCELDFSDDCNLDNTKITLNCTRPVKIKNIKCEENYIFTERKPDEMKQSPIRSK